MKNVMVIARQFSGVRDFPTTVSLVILYQQTPEILNEHHVSCLCSDRVTTRKIRCRLPLQTDLKFEMPNCVTFFYCALVLIMPTRPYELNERSVPLRRWWSLLMGAW
jgi:hypothetical protein